MTSKRQKKSGYPLPPVVNVPGTRQYCVTIPDADEYRDAFLGAVLSLGQWWRWEKSYTAGDTRAKEAAELWRSILVDGINEGCGGEPEMPSIFRENPDDLCDVQFSNDNGLNWFTMFRKDNCIPASSGASGAEININITTIENNNTVYAGDIINIAPEWQYDPVKTDVAMCYAIKQYVDVICEFRLSQETSNEALLSVSNFAETATGLLVKAGIGIAEITGQVLVAAAGAAGWALAKIGFDILNASLATDASALNDLEARDLVACWMFNNMRDATPQFSPWSTSLDDFSSLNENAGKIKDIVDIANQDEDLYVNYLLAFEELNNVAASLPVCDCPEAWEYTFDFVNNNLVDWGLAGDALGVVVADGIDQGINSVTAPTGGGIYSELISVWQYFNISLVPRCNHIEILFDYDKGTFVGNDVAAQLQSGNLGTGNSYLLTLTQGNISTGTDKTLGVDFPLQDLMYINVFLRSHQGAIPAPGTTSVNIKSATFKGLGINPFLP